MNWLALADGPSAAIVLGGTAVATVLRCGWRDTAATVGSLARLWRPAFDLDLARATLAQQVQDIARHGLLRAQPRHLGDAEFDDATDAMFDRRSVGALISSHEGKRRLRLTTSVRAVRFLAQGSELAPVFGLAGTLVSLSQLPGEGLSNGSMNGAIAMAVTTTLYGLLLANLVLGPLARLVERAADAEDADRQDLTDWLAAQVEATLKRSPRLGAAA